jgi:hypothetical protein
MATRQAITRLSARIDRLAGKRHRVIVVGCDEAECREKLAKMRERGEVDPHLDENSILFICTGVPRHRELIA